MMACGSILVYACGVLWMMQFVGGLAHAIYLGVMPFLVGDAIKAAAASALLPIGWRLLGKTTARPDHAS
jgi:biotin transport system substrate-specific component